MARLAFECQDADGYQVRFETSSEDPWLNGVLVEADGDGRATGITQILEPANI